MTQSSLNVDVRMIALDDIQIAERPEEGEDFLFYNPRSLESFDQESMDELVHSICLDGLQQFPIVRRLEDENGQPIFQLVAGERRIRALHRIVDEDLPCYNPNINKEKVEFSEGKIVIYDNQFCQIEQINEDGTLELKAVGLYGDGSGEIYSSVYVDQVEPTSNGSHVYSFVPCKVNVCDDEKALRTAFIENEQHKRLTVAEEIALVERLKKQGYTNKQIANLLNKNEVWVSQTINFRNKLPADAFKSLMRGEITRGVATALCDYKPEERDKVFKQAVQISQEERRQQLSEIEQDQESQEELIELADEEQRIAEEQGNIQAAQQAEKVKQDAAERLAQLEQRKKKLNQHGGRVKTAHVKKAAAKVKASKNNARMLKKEEVIQNYINILAGYLEQFESTSDVSSLPQDESTGQRYSYEMLVAALYTAKGIIEGTSDPLQAIRDGAIQYGLWNGEPSNVIKMEVPASQEDVADSPEGQTGIGYWDDDEEEWNEETENMDENWEEEYGEDDELDNDTDEEYEEEEQETE